MLFSGFFQRLDPCEEERRVVAVPSRPGKNEGEYFLFCNADQKAKEEIEKAAAGFGV